MMRTIKMLGGFSLFGLLLLCVCVLNFPSMSSVSVDFDSYYGTAGRSTRDFIQGDPELQELLSLSVFADVDLSISHAASKHGDDQSTYNKCLSDQGTTLSAFKNPDSGHCVEVMMTTVEENGRRIERFIVRVVRVTKDKFYEITAFSDEWESIAEVERYLSRGGYMQIWP